VLRLTGSASDIVQQSLPVDDPRQRRPDISRVGKLLDWKPGVGFDEGLQRTVGYFRKLLAD
jgi:nucleoside-diphosphate-sugar epimerase